MKIIVRITVRLTKELCSGEVMMGFQTEKRCSRLAGIGARGYCYYFEIDKRNELMIYNDGWMYFLQKVKKS